MESMMRILLTALPFLLALSACGDKPEPATMKPPAPATAQPPGQASPSVSDPPIPTTAGDQPPALRIGKLKYAGNCLGCHGREGAGQGVFPKLAGKPAAELAAKLRDYRAGKTVGSQSATMMPFAKALTDVEIDALAAYLAGL
jgi:cytochrome c553